MDSKPLTYPKDYWKEAKFGLLAVEFVPATQNSQGGQIWPPCVGQFLCTFYRGLSLDLLVNRLFGRGKILRKQFLPCNSNLILFKLIGTENFAATTHVRGKFLLVLTPSEPKSSHSIRNTTNTPTKQQPTSQHTIRINAIRNVTSYRQLDNTIKPHDHTINESAQRKPS